MQKNPAILSQTLKGFVPPFAKFFPVDVFWPYQQNAQWWRQSWTCVVYESGDFGSGAGRKPSEPSSHLSLSASRTGRECVLYFGDMRRGITTCVTTCSFLTLHSSSRRSSRPSWPSMSTMHGWLSLNSIRFQGSSSRRYSSCSNWNTCWQGHATYLKLNLMNKVESTSQLMASQE